MSEEREHPEGWDELVGTEPCPKCGSGDNLKRYADGHAKCYSAGCGYFEAPEEWKNTDAKPKEPEHVVGLLAPERSDAFAALSSRKISGATRKRYGTFTAPYSKQVGIVYPYYLIETGQLAYQKVRLKDKQFPILKAEHAPAHFATSVRLYGWHVWGDSKDRRVVVFEGEEDAHAAAEVTKFAFPCLSIPAGCSKAADALRANWHDLMRYDEIILFFDNDEHGQKAIEECLPLFPQGKLKVARLINFKDASEAHQAGHDGDIEQAIYGAVSYRPPGILNASGLFEDMVSSLDMKKRYHYPWSGLDEMTLGYGGGDVIFHVAGTGVGKSSIVKNLLYHLRTQRSVKDPTRAPKVGYIGLEDLKRDVTRGFMDIHLGKRLKLFPMPPDELRRKFDELFGSGWLEVFDPETAKWGLEDILDYCDYMVLGLGCDVLLVDPLSFAVAGTDPNADTVKLLDKASRDLARKAKELDVPIHITHHLKRLDKESHEEGAQVSLSHIRGSGGIAMFAVYVIGYERDTQGSNPNHTLVRVIKNRETGSQGPASILEWSPITGRLVEARALFNAVEAPADPKSVPGEDEQF